MKDTELLKDQLLVLEMENYQLKQQLRGREFDQFVMESIQRLARTGMWQLDHLSYQVTLSKELSLMLEIGDGLETMTWRDFVAKLENQERSGLDKFLLSHSNQAQQGRYFQHIYQRKNGSALYLKHHCQTFYSTIGRPIKSVGLLQDISEERCFSKELERRAATDELTGLANRRHLNASLARAYEEAQVSQVSFCLILIDVDHFKMVNDTYGHQYGDSVLIELARLLREQQVAGSTLGRWGGEEFLVILPGMSIFEATALANRCRSKLESNLLPNGSPITASFGVAQFDKSDSLDSTLTRVDQMMYQAKLTGRNRVCF